MNTLEELRDKAAIMELAGVNFLGKDGEFARKEGEIAKVEFMFVEGAKLTLPRSEIDRPGFDSLNFNLRPTRNDG